VSCNYVECGVMRDDVLQLCGLSGSDGQCPAAMWIGGRCPAAILSEW
jgi:hypothetical protein